MHGWSVRHWSPRHAMVGQRIGLTWLLYLHGWQREPDEALAGQSLSRAAELLGGTWSKALSDDSSSSLLDQFESRMSRVSERVGDRCGPPPYPSSRSHAPGSPPHPTPPHLS